MMNRLVAVALMGLCAAPAAAQQPRVPRPTPSAPAQEWVEPVRSQANLDALARVQVKTYDFKDAGNPKMEYRLYVPTKYDKAKPTPLVIALHGLAAAPST
jgi:predicted peptidase